MLGHFCPAFRCVRPKNNYDFYYFTIVLPVLILISKACIVLWGGALQKLRDSLHSRLSYLLSGPTLNTICLRSYARAALCQQSSINDDVRSAEAAAKDDENQPSSALPPLPPLPPLLFEAGDRVQLALGWETCDDALKGPLRPGEVRSRKMES